MSANLMMHGLPWDGHNVDGWLASEKFDGCRAFWTGEKLLTKSGREYRNVPSAMMTELSAIREPLDMELCVQSIPRKASLSHARNAALNGVWHEDLRLVVFDAPAQLVNAESRYAFLRGMFSMEPQRFVILIRRCHVRNATDAWTFMEIVKGEGGEGIMLLRPDSLYTPGRRDCLLKMK